MNRQIRPLLQTTAIPKPHCNSTTIPQVQNHTAIPAMVVPRKENHRFQMEFSRGRDLGKMTPIQRGSALQKLNTVLVNGLHSGARACVSAGGNPARTGETSHSANIGEASPESCSAVRFRWLASLNHSLRVSAKALLNHSVMLKWYCSKDQYKPRVQTNKQNGIPTHFDNF